MPSAPPVRPVGTGGIPDNVAATVKSALPEAACGKPFDMWFQLPCSRTSGVVTGSLMAMAVITRTIDDTADTIVYVALEPRWANRLVALRLPGDEERVFHRLEAGNTGAPLAFVATHLIRTEASLGAPITVASCFAAAVGCTGFWSRDRM